MDKKPKLSLHKDTLRSLNEAQMDAVVTGAGPTQDQAGTCCSFCIGCLTDGNCSRH